MSYIFEIFGSHEEGCPPPPNGGDAERRGSMPRIVTDEWLQNIQKDMTRQLYLRYYMYR